MSDSPRVDLLFPYPVITVPPRVDFDASELERLCYDEMGRDPNGEPRSNTGGWQSSKAFLTREEAAPLFNEVSRSVSVGLSAVPMLNNAFGVGAAWVNISPPGAFHWDHVHPNCALSGVFYLKSEGEVSGKIWFSTDQQRADEIENYAHGYRDSAFVWPRYSYNPTPGCCIIFPATLTHRVDQNRGRSDRVSVSFNLVLPNGTTPT